MLSPPSRLTLSPRSPRGGTHRPHTPTGGPNLGGGLESVYIDIPTLSGTQHIKQACYSGDCPDSRTDAPIPRCPRFPRPQRGLRSARARVAASLSGRWSPAPCQWAPELPMRVQAHAQQIPAQPPTSIRWPASCPAGPCTAGPCCWRLAVVPRDVVDSREAGVAPRMPPCGRR